MRKAATALSAAVLLLMTACSGSPAQWQATGSGSGPTTATAGSGAASPSGSASPSGASPGATAEKWKTYSDSAGTVSFDLPQDWIAQQGSPAPGSAAKAIKVDVKNSSGKFIATLQTGLQPAGGTCKPEDAKPYTVLTSVPVDLPHSDSADSIDPRFVFRAIQGYKFFASYGITNVVGGQDGKSCQLSNMVSGPPSLGAYMFGDASVLRPKGPAEPVAPQHAFDTLAQAADYARSSELLNIERMITSLKIKQ